MWALLAVALLAPQEPGGHGDPLRKQQPTLLEEVRPRRASGTAWQPAATPDHAMHSRLEGWDLMAHAAVFIAYDYQTGDRGEDALFSANWLMLMGHRPLAGGEAHLRGMVSLEAITVGDRGYPELFQSGEGLHDRQHPHDLIMELVGGWSLPLSRGFAIELYGGLVGEPALGPVTYHHRESASADPMAPLGHHWQDATHVSHGVLTGALFTSFAKLDASWFNGREPDDNRMDLDLDAPNSGSVRLTVNPTDHLSMQMSTGRLNEPEEHEEGGDVRRTTASITGTGRIGGGGSWSATAIWGLNKPTDGPATNSYLVEASVELDRDHAIFGRVEAVRKTGLDLALGPGLEERTFPVLSFSFGYLYTFTRIQDQDVSLGIRATVNPVDPDLRTEYGDAVEYGAVLYLRIRPSQISATHARP